MRCGECCRDVLMSESVASEVLILTHSSRRLSIILYTAPLTPMPFSRTSRIVVPQDSGEAE